MLDSPLHVLIIEDRPDDAELMVLELEAAGYEVAWKRVETSDDFLDNLNARTDLVLADYSVPNLSAPDALKLLQHSGHDTPFIVVTGTIRDENAVDTMKQGAADYLLKDRLSRLGEAARHALEQRDLRRAQREAERNLIVMGRAIETSINAVVLTDLRGEITYVNRALLDLWGIPGKHDILGRSLAALWQVPTDGLELLEKLQSGKNGKGELTAVGGNGQPIILQYSAGEVLDGQGIPICLMSTFIDVTEQKQAERIRQEAELLKIELEKERELRELKSRFVSMVVHDFRNPLAAIQLVLSMIVRYYDRMTPQQLIERLQQAIRDVKRLNSLVDDVLMIGKMDFVSNEFSPEGVDLNNYIQELFEEFKLGISTDKHELSFKPVHHAVNAMIDKTLFRRALVNLLDNAVKYSPSGGKVRLSLLDDGQSIVMSVSDEGIGIPEEDRKRLFDGFHRASNVGKIEGTGLGLSIVKQIVDVHGGSIECVSDLNQGTTFTIRFPVLIGNPARGVAGNSTPVE